MSGSVIFCNFIPKATNKRHFLTSKYFYQLIRTKHSQSNKYLLLLIVSELFSTLCPCLFLNLEQGI